MYSNLGFSRRAKRGRPFQFKISVSDLEARKQALFEDHESRKEPMTLIKLAHHFGKLTQEEFDIACFLEKLIFKAQKTLGIKKMPASSPLTWDVKIFSVWSQINSQDNPSRAEYYWRLIKNHISKENPKIVSEFFDVIARHHSYEELMSMKVKMVSITDMLKDGLKIVQKMFDDEII